MTDISNQNKDTSSLTDMSSSDETRPLNSVEDCVEAVFQYYSSLLGHLQTSVDASSDYNVDFETFYRKLSNLIRNKLLNCSKEQWREIVIVAKFNLHYQYLLALYKFYRDEFEESKTNQQPNKQYYEHQFYEKILAQLKQEMKMSRQMLSDFSPSCKFRVDSEKTNEGEETKETIAKDENNMPIFSFHERDDYVEDDESDDEEYLKHNIQPREYEEIPTWKKILKYVSWVFPPIDWFPEYAKNAKKDWQTYILGDVLAGLTVGVMLIPQGMAYAMLAGLDPIHGLYASFIPIIVYAFFGTSRQLAVGPVAMISLLTNSGVNTLNPQGPDEYFAYAILISFIAGGIELVLGALRLGFLVNFLSHPVLSGFTSAAAIVIGMSQVKHLLGVSVPGDKEIHLLVSNLSQAIFLIDDENSGIHWPTFGLSIICLIILYGMKYFKVKVPTKTVKIFNREITLGGVITLQKVPASLVLVVVTTLALYITAVASGAARNGQDVLGIKIVGEVEPGLPGPYIPNIPNLDFNKFLSVFLISLPIALVGYMESISVAKFFAIQNDYEVDPNQELIGLGLAQLVGGFFRAYPTTGGFSRTAVNANAGAKSMFAGLISAVLIMFTLLLLTPLFYYLPQAALGSIIIVAVAKLVDLHEIWFTFQTKKRDTFLLIVCFVCTLFVGIEYGILIAVGLSLVLILFRSSRPRVVILGRLPGTTDYRNVKRWKSAIRQPGILIVRVDAQLYFANATYIRDKILHFVKVSDYPVYKVVLDMSSVNEVDSSSVVSLIQLNDMLNSRGIELLFAQTKMAVRDVMRKGGTFEKVDHTKFFMQLHDAVIHAEHDLRQLLQMQEKQGKKSTSDSGDNSDNNNLSESGKDKNADDDQQQKQKGDTKKKQTVNDDQELEDVSIQS